MGSLPENGKRFGIDLMKSYSKYDYLLVKCASLFFLFLGGVVVSYADLYDPPANYYASAEGLSRAALETA